MELDDYFASFEDSKSIFEALVKVLINAGEMEIRVTRSQVAFSRGGRPFAWAWIPGKYLRKNFAPLVFSVLLTHQDLSPRWKQIVEPAPGRFMHHLEIYSIEEIDDEVLSWYRQARRE